MIRQPSRHPISTVLGDSLPASLEWRTELLLIALVAAETAALWIVVELVLASPRAIGGAVPPLALFVLLYGAAMTPRLLDALDIWDRAYALLAALAIAATSVVAIKLAAFPHLSWSDGAWLHQTADALIVRPVETRVPVWGVVLASAYAWWRGRTRATPSVDTAHTMLRGGTLVVLGGVVAHALGSPAGRDEAVSGAVLIFFAGALAAVVLARLRLEHEREPGSGWVRRRWLSAVLLPVVAVLAVAVLAVGVFTRDLLDTVIWAVAPLVWGIGVLLRVVVVAVVAVSFVLVSPLLWLLDGRQRRPVMLELTPAPVTGPDGLGDPVARVAETPDPIRYLVALTVLAILFGGATRFVLRRRRRAGTPADEDRASVLDVNDLVAGWAARVRDLARRARREPDPLAALRADRQWVHTVAIRDTYRRLLRWSAHRGIPRTEATTPGEHAARLAASLAGRKSDQTGPDELAVLIERYHAARYGDGPATAADAAAVRAAWRRLRRVGGG